MGRAVPWIVVLALLLLPRVAFAFGWSTTNYYRHEADTEIVWENDAPGCPSSGACFVLFPRTHNGSVSGTRLWKVSRPVGKAWVLGQRAEDGRFVLYDAEYRKLLFETDSESVAIARYTSLAGRAPMMLDARSGEPRRPVLWRTAESLTNAIEEDVPLLTLIWGLYAWPFYLASMGVYVVLARLITRKLGWVPTVLAVLTSPAIPFALWAYFVVAFA